MSEQSSEPFPHSPGRSILAWMLVASTFVLIFAGGLVTSHGAGLAVPDWPNTYGYNMFFFPISFWEGGIFYEHTHRLIASWVGLLTVILAIWYFGREARPWLRGFSAVCFVVGVAGYFLLSFKRDDKLMFLIIAGAALAASCFWPACGAAPRRMRWLGAAAVGAVILQGVLGGLRVTELKDELGIVHAALAQCFFIFVVSLALFSGKWWWKLRAGSVSAVGGLRGIYWALAGVIFAQLLIAAAMRHQHAGLAIPDFPAAYGQVWPATDPVSVARYNEERGPANAIRPITAFQIQLQMIHRMVAVAIVILAAVCVRRTLRRLGWQNPLAKLAAALMLLVVAQFFLGAATIWTGKSADVATAHVAVGALTLLAASLLCLVSRRLMPSPARLASGELSIFSAGAAVSSFK